MKLCYPAIFDKFESGGGYTVTVPDLPGCVTEGADFAEAYEMAVDAASGWVLDELEDGSKAPVSSDIKAIHTPEGGFVNMLILDMDAYAEKYGAKAVRKNCTIPAWMNTIAEKNSINFSELLASAITEKLHLNG